MSRIHYIKLCTILKTINRELKPAVRGDSLFVVFDIGSIGTYFLNQPLLVYLVELYPQVLVRGFSCHPAP
jgi:hypothetical protein